MNEKLSLKVVALFLLKRLRDAKRARRFASKFNSLAGFNTALGAETEAHNCYQSFWENVSEQYKIPLFVTKNGLKTAKNFFGE